ncbi:hypothetical protein [Orrella marina]|uniref:Uncharacterized protein n=1 Tax=Orrella marina TaxID=2163011 RepID=A0A2R4XF80_9BURK|nr:hypothetical protein [Orrella marina]AWB32389.1 hypothetical protein DBV39_00195 [Orrella marina]
MRHDLAKHLIAGLLIALIVGLAFSRDLDTVSAALTGLTAAILIGALKEAVWDNWLERGVDDKHDLYATMVGGAIGAIVLCAFLYYPA